MVETRRRRSSSRGRHGAGPASSCMRYAATAATSTPSSEAQHARRSSTLLPDAPQTGGALQPRRRGGLSFVFVTGQLAADPIDDDALPVARWHRGPDARKVLDNLKLRAERHAGLDFDTCGDGAHLPDRLQTRLCEAERRSRPANFADGKRPPRARAVGVNRSGARRHRRDRHDRREIMTREDRRSQPPGYEELRAAGEGRRRPRRHRPPSTGHRSRPAPSSAARRCRQASTRPCGCGAARRCESSTSPAGRRRCR